MLAPMQGLTNRALWKIADRVALAHEPRGGAKGRFHVTGNPVRPEFFAVPEPAGDGPFDDREQAAA